MEALTKLKELRQQLPTQDPEDVAVREEMLTEARKLLLDLERPHHTVERVGFQVLNDTKPRLTSIAY